MINTVSFVYLLLFGLSLLFSQTAIANKVVSKCIDANGTERFTTKSCQIGEREVILNQPKTLHQFAMRAQANSTKNKRTNIPSDLESFLKAHYDTRLYQSMSKSYLIDDKVVIEVTSYRPQVLEKLCLGAMNWIKTNPSEHFDLNKVEFKLASQEPFFDIYRETGVCQYQLK